MRSEACRSVADHVYQNDRNRQRCGKRQTIAAQLMGPPPHLDGALQRISHGQVVCDEEARVGEPLCGCDAAVQDEPRDGRDRVQGDASGSDNGQPRPPGLPVHGERGSSEGHKRHGPRFVSRHARQRQQQTWPPRAQPSTALNPDDELPNAGHDESQKQWLGHGCGLQVQKIRVERSHSHGERGTRPRAGGSEHDVGRGRTSEREGRHRNGNARRATSIERIDLNGQQIEQMGKRQPDSADLLPAWRQTVDDAARDNEMRLGVVVSEGEAGDVIMPRGDESDDEREATEQDREVAFTTRRLGRARSRGRHVGLSPPRRGVRRYNHRRVSILQASPAHLDLPMKSLVTSIQNFAFALGGPGLFLIAFLDSSILSLPEINDLLIVWMVSQNEHLHGGLRDDGHPGLGGRLLPAGPSGAGRAVRRSSASDSTPATSIAGWSSSENTDCSPFSYPRFFRRRRRSRFSFFSPALPPCAR